MESRSSRPSLWTRHSSILLGGFLLTIFLIIYIWWPLAEEYLAFVPWDGPWWLYMDWLLIGIFLFMSFTIIAGADLRTDSLIIFVGIFGGLAIESWGTQTNLWHYYTAERPPLWIIPAWPIASLSITRLARLLDLGIRRFLSPGLRRPESSCAQPSPPSNFPSLETLASFLYRFLYWSIFFAFLILMFIFVAPTFDKPYTVLSLLLCVGLVLTPTDHRTAVLTFVCGSALGYFLERWGTTRECWTYYTLQTPPLFAVLAHGMASVVFWRAGLMIKTVAHISLNRTKPPQPA